MVTLGESTLLGSEEMKEMATIYKKETQRPLTNYQRRMNEAAQELCLAHPGLLQKRKILMDAARAQIINEGFQFVKGKLRSKRDADGDAPALKRRIFSQNLRDQRMQEIEEGCKDFSDRIGYKER